MKTIGELLTGREVVTVDPGTTVLEATRTMHDQKVGAILVVATDGSPEGIFTERDLMTRVVAAGLDPAKEAVGVHTTRDIFSVSPERTLNDAAQELQRRHIRHLPVVEGGRVVALLSLRDLLREMLAIKRVEVESLKAYIQGEPE